MKISVSNPGLAKMAAPERYVENTLPAYNAFIAGLSRQESRGGLDDANVAFTELEECKRIRGEVKWSGSDYGSSVVYEYALE